MAIIEQLSDWWAGKPSSERSPLWRSVRSLWLKKHPRCGVCGTRDKLEVHHVWPVHFPGGREKELDSENMITLCRPHHLDSGHSGDWKARNSHVRQDVKQAAQRRYQREYPKK